MVGRAVDSLRALPAVDRDAIARTVAAAARLRAEDVAPNDDDLVDPTPPHRWSMRAAGVAAAAALVLAVGVGAALLAIHRRGQSTVLASAPTRSSTRGSAAAPIVPVAASADAIDSAPIPTQFVFDGPAHHVSLVGDFNGWDEHATPLEREPGSALWSVTVSLQRGRHVYAFIVDSTWTVDRRAPSSRDPDFGVEGSVIIVGRP